MTKEWVRLHWGGVINI